MVMLLVAAGLVVTFGKFQFGSGREFHAEFASVSRLKTGQDVRISGVTVGSVKDIAIAGDHVDVTFDVNDRYQLYTSTRAVDPLRGPRRQPISGDHLRAWRTAQAAPRAPPSRRSNTQPALDLDALLGGLRPVLKGLDGAKVNEVSNAVIELLQGDGGPLSELLSSTGSFTQTLAARDQLIGDVITNLNTVLGTVDAKSSQLDTSIDQLQQLITTLNKGRDPIAGAIEPLASAQSRPDRAAHHVSAAPAGRHREPPSAGHHIGRPQGRREQGRRPDAGELRATGVPGRLRIVLQHLLLRDQVQAQRPGRKRHHPARRRPRRPDERTMCLHQVRSLR